MGELSAYEQAKHRLQEWYDSEKYQQLCQHFTAECARLTETARLLSSRIEETKAFCQEHTVRQELAVQCRYMHRGFYCPSKVFDLVIANSRRGNILKRPNARSKPVYTYGFDADNRLLWCHDNIQNTTEYLLYEDNTIYGISLDADDRFSALSEETYRNGKLTSYFIASCYCLASDFSCDRLFAECYENDEIGLCAAQMYDFTMPRTSAPDFLARLGIGDELLRPNCQFLINWRFERKDGLLTGYHVYPTAFDKPVSPVWPIEKPRMA